MHEAVLDQSRVEHLTADVAVLGGGIAGCLACVGAAEQSMRVVVLEKSSLMGGGDGASGQKHFQSWIPGEREWDNPEDFYQRVLSRYWRLESRKRLRGYAEDVWPMVQRLERMGVRFRHPVMGRYVRNETMGWNASYSIFFDGRDFKKCIARQVMALGVEALEHCVGVSLLTNDGRVTGIVAYDFRSDRLVIVHAGAVILATGHASRLYNGPAGNPYNTWHSPYDTGDGVVIAYRAGAKIANVEFPSATLVPKGYGIPGLAALMGVGGYLINAQGERFMEHYHRLGERAPRPFLVRAVIAENRAGRGPCYVDLTHLSEEVMADLLRHLMLERGMWDEYFDQAQVDVRRRPMEIELGELNFEAGGVLADDHGASSLPGLYAAGECAGASGLSRSSVDGYRAGVNAGQYVARRNGQVVDDEDHIEAARTRLADMRSTAPGPTYRDLEQAVREIMGRLVTLDKDEEGLQGAIRELEALRSMARELRARNSHEVLRGLEAQNILDFAILITTASIGREAAGEHLGGTGALFWRTDRAESDPANWERLVTIQQQDGRPVARLEPIPD